MTYYDYEWEQRNEKALDEWREEQEEKRRIQQEAHAFWRGVAENTARNRVLAEQALLDHPGPCDVLYVRYGHSGKKHFETLREAYLWAERTSDDSSAEWCHCDEIIFSDGSGMIFGTEVWEIAREWNEASEQ